MSYDGQRLTNDHPWARTLLQGLKLPLTRGFFLLLICLLFLSLSSLIACAFDGADESSETPGEVADTPESAGEVADTPSPRERLRTPPSPQGYPLQKQTGKCLRLSTTLLVATIGVLMQTG